MEKVLNKDATSISSKAFEEKNRKLKNERQYSKEKTVKKPDKASY